MNYAQARRGWHDGTLYRVSDRQVPGYYPGNICVSVVVVRTAVTGIVHRLLRTTIVGSLSCPPMIVALLAALVLAKNDPSLEPSWGCQGVPTVQRDLRLKLRGFLHVIAYLTQ